MKKIALLLAVVFLVSLPNVSKAANPQSGNKCSKVGLTQIYKSKKFTCIKSGKKLIWNKGVATVIAPTATTTPTPTPTPTPTSIPTSTATPTPEFEAPLEPTSFDNLVDRADGVPYWAWKKSRDVLQSNISKSIAIVRLVGPNTTILNFGDKEAFKNVSSIFSNFTQVGTIYEILFNYQDTAWAQTEFAKLGLKPTGSESKNMCQTPETCWGALAEVDFKGNAITLWGVSDIRHEQITMSNGTKAAHEFFHTIQMLSFKNGPLESEAYCCIKRNLPPWYVEGQATLVGSLAMYWNNFNEYKRDRVSSINELQKSDFFTSNWFENYLDLSNSEKWYTTNPGWRQYDVGSVVLEILTAISGPEKTMDLVAQIGGGSQFVPTFEKLYGIKWNEALPKISEAATIMLKKGFT